MTNNSVGNKAKNLLWLQERIKHVPDFLIIDPTILVQNYDRINAELEKLLKEGVHEASRFEEAINRAVVNEKEAEKIHTAVSQIPGSEMIFRTSAEREDSSTMSFAGMYVSPGPYSKESVNLEKVLRQCWSSLYSKRILAYLDARHQKIQTQNFCIIAQEFYTGLFSGVAFVDPKKKRLIITIGKGSQAVVEGGDAETLELSYTDKTMPDLVKSKVEESTWEQLLQALMSTADTKAKSQDIEWIIDNNNFAVVQTRDVTTPISESKEEIVWDSTNIAESYPGVTLPLTFSFIRYAYSRVYPSFLELVGVSKENIESKKTIFNNLLGHIQGHVYYNVHSWYEMIKLLPGYRYNKGFFEAMWNPKKKLAGQTKVRTSLVDKITLIPLALRFLVKIVFISGPLRRFLSSYEKAINEYSQTSIKDKKPEELKPYYRSVEETFFSAWSVPILNDFRVMIFHGVLRRLVTSERTEEQTDRLVSSLLTQDIVIQSLAPIEDVIKLVKLCRSNTELWNAIISKKDNTLIYKYICEDPDAATVRHEVSKYIENYGDRNPSELKLESPTMKEQPELLIGLIKKYENYDSGVTSFVKKGHDNQYQKNYQEFKSIVLSKSRILFPVLWPISNWILRSAKNAVATREHLRLLRSTAFGLARDMFNQFGHIFEDKKIIDSRHDIYYLTREEILGLGDSDERRYKDLVKDRKNNFDRYFKAVAPARRIKTVGYPDVIKMTADEDDSSTDDKDEYKGIAASPGSVKGTVLCLKEYDPNQDFKGKILITLQTDPGWTTVFPLIAGLVTERGNILSHAAIVSRELGIPSVLAIERITDILKTGDTVELDGNLGLVKKIK